MMTHHAIEMFEFHVWANRTMIQRLKEIPRDVYIKEVQSSFSSISKAMPHIYLTDYNWLGILQGKDMKESSIEALAMTEQIEAMTLGELEAEFEALSERYRTFLNTCEDLNQTFVLDNPYTRVKDVSYGEVIMQVVNHGTYHRGNISTMLRDQGLPSVMTEYALYWYEK
ncbi:DinB family protein [Paenibacillus guangzhouensis]|uniref:DinB family protein n=1 Tax=Paenibacillus guangzhouensis TaxID=1473112 RepID=UPI002AB20423|nr:DinB family protein [Paenibacillus guangzhouensis]